MTKTTSNAAGAPLGMKVKSRSVATAKAADPDTAPGRGRPREPERLWGGKYRRGRGGAYAQTNASRDLRNVDKGPVVSDRLKVEECYQRPAPAPLSAAARKLLLDYIKRKAFFDALEEGMPLDEAAEAILGVKARQAQKVRNELDAAGGPLREFRLAVIEGINAGTIGRADATEPSHLAQSFYVALAGGKERAEDLRVQAFGLRSQVYVRDIIHQPRDFDREFLIYLVFQHVRASKRSRRGKVA